MKDAWNVNTNLAAETIPHTSQFLDLQSSFEMIDNDISDWINGSRIMTSEPFWEINFAAIKRFWAQRIPIEEVWNDGQVPLSGEVVCHQLDILVDRTEDVAKEDYCIPVRIGGAGEICCYCTD